MISASNLNTGFSETFNAGEYSIYGQAVTLLLKIEISPASISDDSMDNLNHLLKSSRLTIT